MITVHFLLLVLARHTSGAWCPFCGFAIASCRWAICSNVGNTRGNRGRAARSCTPTRHLHKHVALLAVMVWENDLREYGQNFVTPRRSDFLQCGPCFAISRTINFRTVGNQNQNCNENDSTTWAETMQTCTFCQRHCATLWLELTEQNVFKLCQRVWKYAAHESCEWQ